MIDLFRPAGTRGSFGRRRKAALTPVMFVLLACCLLPGASAFAAGSTGASDLSQANQLLFTTDHLANVDLPAQISYRFRKKGGKDDFTDHINLTVDGDKSDDEKHVRIDFLSGERSRYIPDIANAHGNPVIMLFLQQDVVAMAHQTGGNWRYFQKRIKLALANAANVVKARVDYNGHEVDAQKVVITPFRQNKQHRDDIGSALDKRYVFTLSQQVPGGVLEMRAETPDVSGKPLMTEELKLQSIHHQAAKTSDDESEAS